MNSRQLFQIEDELKKRLDHPYSWGRKQNDQWDRFSGFIYRTQSWEEVLEQAGKVAEQQNLEKASFINYAANRWYNFWSAKAVESIFCDLPGVTPARDERDRLRDFNIQGVDMDLKTSIYPRGFNHALDYAQRHPGDLVTWLYRNQSSQQRMHYYNRLFLIVYAEGGDHWKLKAEILFLKEVVEDYVVNFDSQKLLKFQYQPGKFAFSDIIWAIK
ncbi:hypothetical protein FHG64_09405 [Antarcticibacterium flavum]|uniref:Uncharacterized protein n=1 Tax=Antarcticibacterium flavum TaxID=2058175 RepID=A0A5B7X3F0_9FLAO|nr:MULTISPECIES: hypothetical protein [Antarcticibacterium]MCM4159197.1 hypothetical protein [Antarcticibacterium sp. W02-3]QCY69595.1 hypothetical protein FHG64_09405 [Antarcticibacterium flavum]